MRRRLRFGGASVREISMIIQLVAFTLDEQAYALPLACVDRIVPSMEVTRAPQAPEIVLGVINFHGRILPALDIRARFGLHPREAGLNGQFVIARAGSRAVALPVDSVVGVIDRSPDEITATPIIVPGLAYVDGVAKLDDGLVFIHDLDRFLSLDEERRLTDLTHGDSRIGR
jgi:purine-binding chemotaxis protein CheW